MASPKVTERTFYPPLMNLIVEAGGTGVSEVRFNSEPDIVFTLGGHRWLLSVKIGESAAIIKGALIQYWRHKRESGIPFGILLFLPDQVRNVAATQEAVEGAVRQSEATALIDADFAKEEARGRTFPEVIDLVRTEILARLQRKQHTYYSLPLVIALLREQVEDVMRGIHVTEAGLLRIITDRDLLMDLGHISPDKVEDVARFLASYILMSQIMFLRLLHAARPAQFPCPPLPVTPYALRRAFGIVLEVNYRPIYQIDVLDAIPEAFLRDSFDLLWGLEIERVRYELPGRIFHELMPTEIRKMLAAFYTRPQAADILAQLAISRSGQTVLDPACGSGTILTSAYRAKLRLFHEEGLGGDPHARFCENEIFGGDIMPFAVHLASANLSAMNPGTTIQRTQIVQGDTLTFLPGNHVNVGVQLTMFPKPPQAETTNGEPYDVELKNIDVILMNPPFTKVERGISKFVDMDRFQAQCGGEVGLWGHFLSLAGAFLKPKGTLGCVIPINILRGRESEKVRHMLFNEWTPLHVLKATRNYGFSEWAEYRDILFLAEKGKPPQSHKVKFCLIKQDLKNLTAEDARHISERVKGYSHLQSAKMDIESFPLDEINRRFDNLMWFCGVTDFKHREVIVKFLDKISGKLTNFPDGYFREGYRPVPKGVSNFLFLTRDCPPSRAAQAFLRFSRSSAKSVRAESELGVRYEVERSALLPTLRTPIGLSRMDIGSLHDWIAFKPYSELERVCGAAGFRPKKGWQWDEFFDHAKSDLERTKTRLVVVRRINPFSPETHLAAFYSPKFLYPSNQMNVICEKNSERARAVCALLNSAFFFANFFLLKEESTGRYIDVRFYDLHQMALYPPDSLVPRLAKVFKKYRRTEFRSLAQQFDVYFEDRYREFWEAQAKGARSKQRRLWTVLGQPVKPSPERLKFDMEICDAIGVNVSKKEITELYDVLVREMTIIRHLARD
ncbi:MAG: N-6 DNA methylase [Planctomycetota bacterium]